MMMTKMMMMMMNLRFWARPGMLSMISQARHTLDSLQMIIILYLYFCLSLLLFISVIVYLYHCLSFKFIRVIFLHFDHDQTGQSYTLSCTCPVKKQWNLSLKKSISGPVKWNSKQPCSHNCDENLRKVFQTCWTFGGEGWSLYSIWQRIVMCVSYLSNRVLSKRQKLITQVSATWYEDCKKTDVCCDAASHNTHLV